MQNFHQILYVILGGREWDWHHVRMENGRMEYPKCIINVGLQREEELGVVLVSHQG